MGGIRGHVRGRIITTNRNEMQIMYSKSTYTVYYLEDGPRDTYTHTAKRSGG